MQTILRLGDDFPIENNKPKIINHKYKMGATRDGGFGRD
jgi:hypothetical protein